MSRTLIFIIIFTVGEIVAFFIFKIMNYCLERKWEFRINISVIKGEIERLFLFLSLAYNFPHALIAFGAIKIGTRIKPDKKISNDYFFIGNIVSLLISIIYFGVWDFLTKG